MKILVDKNIPYARNIFKKFGEVKLISGRSIVNSSLINVDALIIRSDTKINKTLLKNNHIKFIGTTTSGYDHVDKNWLKKNNIFFSYAPSCNSISVVEYVLSALLCVAEKNKFDLKEKTVGIIGFGHIGSLLYKYLNVLEINTLICDPVKENMNFYKKQFVSLEKLINNSDIITLHTNLNFNKKYSSYHLLDKTKIESLKNNSILLNTSRGSIINNKELLKVLEEGKKIDVVLDVWENEPDILLPLLNKVKIATPHIAGYSIEGRIRGIIKIFSDFKKFLNYKENDEIKTLLKLKLKKKIDLHTKFDQKKFIHFVRLVYDICYDDSLLRRFAHIKGKFDYFRKNYRKRREWSSILINCNDINIAKILKKLGFKIKIV